jgi:hypothetical protein
LTDGGSPLTFLRAKKTRKLNLGTVQETSSSRKYDLRCVVTSMQEGDVTDESGKKTSKRMLSRMRV